tara:strand:- start:630 stop:818 length:189 start_codon:yes stop_codon:yes gene_type:complete
MKDYKAAYNILMDYWNCIPEEERLSVHKLLEEALDNKLFPPRNAISNAIKRLRDECGFGIPD